MINIIDNLSENKKIERIKTLDNIIESQRPTNICVGGICGEIRYAKTADSLYFQIAGFEDKVPSFKDLIVLRIASFNELLNDFPELLENNLEDYSSMKEIFARDNLRFGIWKQRLTSSTNMVRIGKQCQGHLYFADFFPDSFEYISQSITGGKISDGGFKYSKQAINQILSETTEERKLSWRVYEKFKGGNFSGIEWLHHPVFNAAVGDKKIILDYVFALNTLRSLQLISQPNSGWCPREMRSGYGRPISLGFGADAFYPPNNTTVSHAMLIIK